MRTPEILFASWTSSDGAKKESTGLRGEEVYITAQLKYFDKQKVVIHFMVNGKRLSKN